MLDQAPAPGHMGQDLDVKQNKACQLLGIFVDCHRPLKMVQKGILSPFEVVDNGDCNSLCRCPEIRVGT